MGYYYIKTRDELAREGFGSYDLPNEVIMNAGDQIMESHGKFYTRDGRYRIARKFIVDHHGHSIGSFERVSAEHYEPSYRNADDIRRAWHEDKIAEVPPGKLNFEKFFSLKKLPKLNCFK